MNLSFAYTHSPIEFYFRQSPRDFVVEEVPLYPFSREGIHLVLKIRKRNLTTFELLKILSNHLGIKEKDIGYAGLKDKNALTIQHISLPLSIREKLESFIHVDIKILESTLHNNKIKIGHLKGNRFFIRIKKLNSLNAQKAVQVIESIKQFGIPNYFSYQRFGMDCKNYLQGKEIVEKKRYVRDKKMRNFLISSYQSYLFNKWLSLRIDISHIITTHRKQEIPKAIELYLKTNTIPTFLKECAYCNVLKAQKHPFKLLEGDMLCHYPFGKHFVLEDLERESLRFLQKDIAPTGLLSGKKTMFSQNCAKFFEEQFLDCRIQSVGQRRYAWIFPQDLEFFYKEEEAQGELRFFLPKGAYATNLLRELAHREIMEGVE
ncbi:tRNA pseudouridine(13) synthase TruD [Helicobacter turcicus]|uniref:tRNA pseudouridine synthase D n=1 Tax=Helicobacter turcicus TaxID=2867412 RepID=A0ABS7JKY6_9HELI|nr:tRNA pseudouridine(13) synthase TruD [Helicobacter turcicus]MBX7490062.1 tRNA pseudouridine(13) synthase TruD [Helicobacter turcicus]MBX7544921.1 tRNA pseudouridine(13) synthase TruD [Helicobacter turcicus]